MAENRSGGGGCVSLYIADRGQTARINYRSRLTLGLSSMNSTPTILVIEDEQEIRRFLRVSLNHQGYQLIEAETGATGIRSAADEQPDLILLDLGLPDVDGLHVIEQVRSWSQVPIIVLSARGQEREKVVCDRRWRDDYITKPFGMSELMARIRVALRNQMRVSGEGDESVFMVGNLCVDLAARRVTVNDSEVHLTPIEYRLLTTLIKHAGKVITHRQLLKEVWGPGTVEETHYLRVYTAQLRRKLEADPARPRLLLTEPGVGYRLAND